MEVNEDVSGGEEFGVHQRSEEKLKYTKSAEKPDHKQWKKEVAAVIPPVCSAVDLEQQSGTIWVPAQYLSWPVGVIVVQLTELQLRDRQLRFITLP